MSKFYGFQNKQKMVFGSKRTLKWIILRKSPIFRPRIGAGSLKLESIDTLNRLMKQYNVCVWDKRMRIMFQNIDVAVDKLPGAVAHEHVQFLNPDKWSESILCLLLWCTNWRHVKISCKKGSHSHIPLNKFTEKWIKMD